MWYFFFFCFFFCFTIYKSFADVVRNVWNNFTFSVQNMLEWSRSQSASSETVASSFYWGQKKPIRAKNTLHSTASPFDSFHPNHHQPSHLTHIPCFLCSLFFPFSVFTQSSAYRIRPCRQIYVSTLASSIIFFFPLCWDRCDENLWLLICLDICVFSQY